MTRSSYARSVPSSASTDRAHAMSAARASASASATASASSACIGSVPLMSVSPSFGASTSGASPSAASTLGGRAAVQPALADQRQRDRGELGQVAGRADRALGRDGREQVAVEQLEQPLRQLRAAAGRAGGDSPGAQQQQRPDRVRGQRVAGAGGVRADQRQLHRLKVLAGHRDVGERAEAGAHAVHHRAALDRVGDDAAGGRHPLRHVGAELGPGTLPGHVHHVVECEPVAVDENRPHPEDRSAGYPPPVRTLLDWIDAVNAAHPWSHNDHYLPWVLRQLPAHARDALDVGCGTGTLLAALAARLPHVEGIDRDPAMAARSGARQVDLFDLPAEPAYDVVTAVAVLHHLPLEPALNRLRILLRPGGRLLVVGCYRQETAADRAIDLLAVPANLAIGLLSRRRAATAMSAPTEPARETLREIRAAAPAAIIRRRLFWRYTLVEDAARAQGVGSG